MSDRIRQHLITVIVALVVGALAGAASSAMAQAPAPDNEPVFETAGFDADSVDGRHATKYTTYRGKRAGKLVATNSNGYLPSNILKPQWRVIQNMPTGFKDGVDNIGPSYSSRELYDSVGFGGPLSAGGTRRITVAGMPRNADVHFSIVPLQTNHTMGIKSVDMWWANDGGHSYTVTVGNRSPWPVQFKLRAMIFGDGIAPAALKRALKTAEVKVLKKRK